MLTPETLSALQDALDAVIAQAGDDPKYADLAEKLDDASQALKALGPDEEEPREDAGDDYDFEVAEKRHKERKA